MELSNDQNRVLENLNAWIVSPNTRFITLGGYAGTGKTTLIAIWRKLLYERNPKTRVAFCSYTGKATRVLKSRLANNEAMFEKDSIGTIHSLIYSPIVNDKKEIIGWKLKDKVDADLIIVDEASMIDEAIWKGLLQYKKPIIAIGDHGQLPPIKGSFNLMDKPMLILNEIHRQAKGNPIIELSILARKEGKIPPGNYGIGVKKISRDNFEANEIVEEALRSYNSDSLILCGYNHTRIKLNKFIRKALEFETEEPQMGDRVICLRNNHEKEIYNGMLGTIIDISPKSEEAYEALIQMDEENDTYSGRIFKKQFNSKEALNFTENRRFLKSTDLFDFGYALTVHKAQGSQARKVILFEERFPQMDESEWRRWLYTAVTRAESELLVFG